MGKSQTQRQAEYEQRIKDEGGRIIKAKLEPDAVAVLDEFKKRCPDMTQGQIVGQAILTLGTMHKHFKGKSDQAVVVLGKYATQKLDELVEDMQHNRTRSQIAETAILHYHDTARGGLV